MDDFAYLPATELAARLRRREISPVELTTRMLERIAARNPSLHAFVHLAADEALAAARRAEQALLSGAELGPLHGVPVAIKDLFDFKPGWPATLGGIRALADFRPPIHCAFAERIEAAGAIVLGKT
ncbi:MAG: Asp-tRNA(Asn)/Glu-tRNA(Gln) amidotransferase GatCAB subunit A, partial [Burkholderiales bacterium]|nr:Asp-tRNA(Asn)/Glu-tRNA(Gln) amidotransferase GatCAB subunit A [Burkholderiales bacterium]